MNIEGKNVKKKSECCLLLPVCSYFKSVEHVTVSGREIKEIELTRAYDLLVMGVTVKEVHLPVLFYS